MGGVGGVTDPQRRSLNLKRFLSTVPGVWVAVPCTMFPPGSSSTPNAKSSLFEPVSPVNANSTEPQSFQQSRIGSLIASPERRWSEGMGGSQAEPPVQWANRGTPIPLLVGARAACSVDIKRRVVWSSGPGQTTILTVYKSPISKARRDKVVKTCRIHQLLRP